MNPQAEEVEYEGLPDSAGHSVHMFAGALVSSSASRATRKLPQWGETLTK